MVDAPTEEDTRYDDTEYNVSLEPTKSRAWLNLLEESERAFEPWNTHCDNIDKLYANLERLCTMGRDKQFQMFWANIEVIKPAIYAQAPVPVVVPKFKDRLPVYDAASELLERCVSVAFDLAKINEVMLQIRDDVSLIGRGVPWCRYEGKKSGVGYYAFERVCIDFKHRRDFLHSLSRCWYEVTWVAAASYLTRSEARERFHKYSGDCYQDAEYEVQKDTQELGGSDNRERAAFWEVWDKPSRRVVWVAKGCEDVLDESDPHLDLEGYFPCPKPAYGTCQRHSLIPVPDVLQYKDQLDEINLLTARIHALSDAVRAKGFYPGGTPEVTDAIQTAFNINTPGEVLVPISNWAAFGSTKEVIVWMPIDMIAQTITVLIATRKQVIDDIYQIMGLSDIMRGATDARETLGAQQLKSEYGSSRVRDKQNEMARVAKDLVGIVGEIITEKFDDVTMIEMSQTQLPTQQMQQQAAQAIQQQLQQKVQQIQQAAQNPQIQQAAQQNPQAVQQVKQQVDQLMQQQQAALGKITSKPTIEQVFTFLRDNRAKCFVLDIETDSTILADETGEKQRRSEFTGMLAQLLPQLMAMVAAAPQTTDLAGQILQFAVAPFRVSRSLNGAIDDMVEQAKQTADQPRPDDPATAQNKTALQIEQMKQDRQKDRDQADVALKAKELQMRDEHEKMKLQSQQQIEMMKLQGMRQGDATKARQSNQKAMHDREAHQADMLKTQADMMFASQKADIARQAAIAKQGDMAARANERRAAQAFKQSQPPQGFQP